MTLIATAGASTANSYCTVAQALLLLNDRLDTAAFTDAAVLQQEQGLIWATRLLDEQAHWTTTPTTTTQALWWPCADAVDARGRVLASDTIPRELEQATAEYALHLLGYEATEAAATLEETVSRLRFGTVEIDFHDRPATTTAVTATRELLPLAVRRLIAVWAQPIGSGQVRVVRV